MMTLVDRFVVKNSLMGYVSMLVLSLLLSQTFNFVKVY